MRESAEAWGWAPGSFQLRSGSGLDRDNRVSPEQLARLVRVVTLDLSLAPEFLSSLPIVGKDGTLRKKLGLLPEGAIVRAKGGSLDGVASLSGLAVDREGRKYVFAVLVNHPEAIHLNVGFWQELLVKALLGSC
jgi:D-alanyl-D-alanine carboxypeptidase/D-alanyl-D-alanine-endopeptidase (penicillin-binding protein 4)